MGVRLWGKIAGHQEIVGLLCFAPPPFNDDVQGILHVSNIEAYEIFMSLETIIETVAG